MTKTSTSHLLSGVLGGLIVLAVGAILIATDVIDTGDTVRETVQSPISRPAADDRAEGGDDSDGLTVSEIYERDGPGVVFISARGVEGSDVFGEGRGGAATGSGFVLDREGFVLTNAHVVQGADDVTVDFGDRDEADARVVGSDPSTDLAVLKIDPKDVESDLRPLGLGDSRQIEVGDPAIAIGNPFGFDRTVTTGIISALQRQITAPNGFAIDNVIQTDAPINPGNSGGPLLDASGRVIGINSQIATGGGSGGSVGIGFAVPINTAKTVIPQLKRDGEIKRAFLGITTAPVTERLSQDLNLPAEEGALVQEVVDGGPADRAGLRAGRTPLADEQLVVGGDLIVKVDGQEIHEPADVAAAINDDKPGDTVEIEFFRGRDKRTVRAKLGERPKEAPRERRQQDEDAFPFP